MKTVLAFFVSLLFIAGIACSKNSPAEEDNTLPVITIASPTEGASYSSATPLNIAAMITDNSRISEIHLHISNYTSGGLLLDVHRFPAQPSYKLNENFTMQPATQYKVQIIATDNSGNQAIATVLINSQ